MKTSAKRMIESTFRDSILQVCKRYAVAINEISLRIRFLAQGKRSLELCERDIPKEVIPFETLMHPKMLGLRFNSESIISFFECIHHAFMIEKECVNQQRIHLIFYQSNTVNAPCVGIIYDDKPIKTLRVVDIFDAMDIGYEQLN
jgi:hypothetical protein